MRRFFTFIMLIVLMLSLSGCTVNWFDKHYEVPWFVIAIPVVIIFIIAHMHIMSRTYICPNCGTKFKPKWYQFSAYVHLMGERLIKCPNCQKKDWCKKI